MSRPDFRSITRRSRQYNFHSHTQYCDGRATVGEFAAAAAAAGFTDYGYTPHSPVPIVSPCNMAKADVPAYIAEVEAQRHRYGDAVRFYTGMEIDYLGPDWGPSHPYFGDLGLDYSIGSVHFIPDKNGTPVDIDGNFERFSRNMATAFDCDIRYVVDSFYSQSLAMIEAGGFDILGHFDKVAHNAARWQSDIEDEPWYMEWIDRMFEAIEQSGVVVEINTKSYLRTGRLFPSLRHLPRLLAGPAAVVVNSDAHEPQLIDASRQVVLELLQKYRRGQQA